MKEIDLPIEDLKKLPIINNAKVKSILFVEEEENGGDNVAVYKHYGYTEPTGYYPFCSNNVFYEIAESFPRPYLNKSWKHKYEDYSTGEECEIDYVFEYEKDWKDDSCYGKGSSAYK